MATSKGGSTPYALIRTAGALLRRFLLRPLLAAAALVYFLIDAVALDV